MRLGALVGLVPLLGFLLLWQIAVAAHLYPPVLLPPPAKVAGAFVLYGPSIAANTLASVTRVLIGVGLNAMLGWWWADPLAGLVIVYYGLTEGHTAWKHSST